MLGAPCSPCCGPTCSFAGLESSVQSISVQWETSGLSSGTWPLGAAVGGYTDPAGNVVVQSASSGGYFADGGTTQLLIPGTNYIAEQPTLAGTYSPIGQTKQIFNYFGNDPSVSNKLMAIFYCGTESTWTIPGNYLWVQLIADVVAAEVQTTFAGGVTSHRATGTNGVGVGYSSANQSFEPSIFGPDANPQYHFGSFGGVLRSWITWTGDRPTQYPQRFGPPVQIDKYILPTDTPYMMTYEFTGSGVVYQKVVARFLLPLTIIGEVRGQEYELYGSTTISTDQHQQIRTPYTAIARFLSITRYGLLNPLGWDNTAIGRIEPVQEYLDRFPLNTPYHNFTLRSSDFTIFTSPDPNGEEGVHPGVKLGVGPFGTVRQGPTFTATITRP